MQRLLRQIRHGRWLVRILTEEVWPDTSAANSASATPHVSARTSGRTASKVDNRRLLLMTSAVSAALALAFGLVVSTGTTDISVIYALTLLSGLVLAIARPAMPALLFQLVGRDDLPSAVAANSTIMSVSRLVGPALGGALVAVTGIASCFYANAISYIAVLASISRSRLVPRPMSTQAGRNLRAALTFVRHRPEVRRPLIVMAVVGLVALNFQTTFPSMVRFGFDRGAGAVDAGASDGAPPSGVVRQHPDRRFGDGA